MSTFRTKDPQAKRSYTFNWGAKRLAPGDTIATSAFAVVPNEGGGVVASEPSKTDTATKVKLAGGILGKLYYITNHIVTMGGDEEDWTLVLKIESE